MTDILDAKHSKANLEEVVQAADRLTNKEREQLCELLKKHEEFLFDGRFGAWNGEPHNNKMKDNIEPHHDDEALPFPAPKIHVFTLKSELATICSLGVFKRVNRSQW
jgi:hypothetical protein